MIDQLRKRKNQSVRGTNIPGFVPAETIRVGEQTGEVYRVVVIYSHMVNREVVIYSYGQKSSPVDRIDWGQWWVTQEDL